MSCGTLAVATLGRVAGAVPAALAAGAASRNAQWIETGAVPAHLPRRTRRGAARARDARPFRAQRSLRTQNPDATGRDTPALIACRIRRTRDGARRHATVLRLGACPPVGANAPAVLSAIVSNGARKRAGAAEVAQEAKTHHEARHLTSSADPLSRHFTPRRCDVNRETCQCRPSHPIHVSGSRISNSCISARFSSSERSRSFAPKPDDLAPP